jgi:acetyltransferase
MTGTHALIDSLARCPLRGAVDLQQPYRETLVLRGGHSVLLRPAHHRDAPALQRFFSGLSPRSRLLRFHGAINRLPDTAARSMSTQVAARHVAIVALAPDGELCAEARYAIDGDTPDVAEFAIAVADAHQGQGLGRALLLRLAVHARESGLAVLRGSVMPGNEPMLALMRALGAEVRSHGAEVQGAIRLTGASP